MENEHGRVHAHMSYVDTCVDCISARNAAGDRFARQAGRVSGGKRGRIVSVYPNPVWAQVYNEDTGKMYWFEVHQDDLVALLDADLGRAIG